MNQHWLSVSCSPGEVLYLTVWGCCLCVTRAAALPVVDPDGRPVDPEGRGSPRPAPPPPPLPSSPPLLCWRHHPDQRDSPGTYGVVADSTEIQDSLSTKQILKSQPHRTLYRPKLWNVEQTPSTLDQRSKQSDRYETSQKNTIVGCFRFIVVQKTLSLK